MAKKNPKQDEAQAPAEGNTNEISLAEICKEMGIKPQGARVKLRKKLGTESKGEGFRWVFPIERKDEIVALLTPAAKAEAAEGNSEE